MEVLKKKKSEEILNMNYGEENGQVNLSQIYRQELQLGPKRPNTEQPLTLGKKKMGVDEKVRQSMTNR